jgi:hypothetical protein
VLNSNGDVTDVDDIYATLDTDGQGNWVAAWLSASSVTVRETELLVSRSVNAGDTWSEAVRANVGSVVDRGVSTLYPHVRADRQPGGRWILAWDAGSAPYLDEHDLYNLVYSVSEDGGATWLGPAATGSPEPNGPGGRWPSLTPDGAGEWLAVWTSFEDFNDQTGTDGEIFHATIGEGPAGPDSDVNDDGPTDALDVQLVVNEVLGIDTGFDTDINDDGGTDAIDVQAVVNAVLGVAVSR